jgi:hypothetical protein
MRLYCFVSALIFHFIFFFVCVCVKGGMNNWFTVVAALNGNAAAVSFQSTNFPTLYIGPKPGTTQPEGDFVLGIVTGDVNDLSWKLVNGLAGAAGTTLTLLTESVNPLYAGMVMAVSATGSSEWFDCII